jgi:hypothetical protein
VAHDGHVLQRSVQDHRGGPGITVADESLAAYIVALHNENLGRLVFL